MSFALRAAPPPPAPVKDKETFPWRTFSVALLAALGLFYYAAFRLPEVPADGSPTIGCLVWLGKCVSGSYSAALGLVLLLPLVPGFFIRFGARAYLVRLAFLFTVLLTGLWGVAEHPFDILYGTVNQALDQPRELSPDKAGRG